MMYGRECFSVFLFLLKFFCKIDMKIEGTENIPKGENFIIAAKHVSVWETFFFAWYFHIPVYILKKELMYIPVFGWFLWRTGMVGIDRKGGKSARNQIVEASFDIIEKQKRNLIIFPQGTRTPIDSRYSLEKYPYKKGILSMCENLPNVKVLLATNNSVKYFGKSFFSLKKAGTVTIKFLPSIQMKGKTGNEFLKEIQDNIETETKKII
jgi:1-acyl-sn-glycerol-3-phosphate acyltransferase